MPSHIRRGLILRTAPLRDQYMVWSTIAGTASWIGTRAELLDLAAPDELPELRQRLDRADITGTSSRDGEGSYDDYDAAGVHHQGFGWIPRKHLAAYADATVTYWNTLNDIVRPTAQETADA